MNDLKAKSHKALSDVQKAQAAVTQAIAKLADILGSQCKGRNCTAINGHGHSVECLAEHDEAYEGIWIETPESKNIRRFSYKDNSLVIEYKNEQQYQFLDVPLAVFNGMKLAESPGAYLNIYIKGVYRYYHLNGS